MATATNPQPGQYVHEYHADAYVLSATLEQPIEQQVEPQGWVEIREVSDDSLYKFQDLQSFRVQGIISYQGGYSQVGVAGVGGRLTEFGDDHHLVAGDDVAIEDVARGW